MAVDTAVVRQWLNEPTQDVHIQVKATLQELLYNLNFWLALHEPRFCNLTAQRSIVERGVIPQFFPLLDDLPTYSTVGVLSSRALCVLKYTIDENIQLPPMAGGTLPSLPPMRLIVRTFGHDDELAQTLVSLVEAWNASGRLTEQKLRVYAYTNAPEAVVTAAQDIVLKRQWTHFIFRRK